jgi:two-component system response regulator GlrR
MSEAGNGPVTAPTGRDDLGAGSVRGFSLEVVEGPDAGRTWEAAGSRATIGSHASCELVLGDPTVSRFHCEVSIEASGTRVRDLGSRNGTVLDGTRIVDGFLRGDSLLRLGRSAVRFRFLGRANRVPLSSRQKFGSLVGTSIPMRQAFALLERAAASDATVLLEGETGTGKSAAARAVHGESKRAAGPLVMIDCGAIPGTLLESELFGHERGAFTGATGARIGAFEEAHGGTLFLDEIGELPLALQPKLLGVLDARAVRRLGGTGPRPVDVRLIAATNRDLRAEVNAGRFREDLYFRLAVVKLTLPPLRQRPEDLAALAGQILAQLGADEERSAALLSEERLAQLRASAWPGNVRELRNYLEQCLVFDDVDAPPESETEQVAAPTSGLTVDATLPLAEARRRLLDDFERAYVAELLALHDGKVSSAAAAAGVDRTYFYKLLRRYRSGS